MNQHHPNARTAVAVGTAAPDFALADSEGTLRSLSAALSAGALVLIFYRGDW